MYLNSSDRAKPKPETKKYTYNDYVADNSINLPINNLYSKSLNSTIQRSKPNNYFDMDNLISDKNQLDNLHLKKVGLDNIGNSCYMY